MACFPKYKDGSTVNRRKRNQKWSHVYACLLPHWHWSPTRWQFEHIFSLLYLSRKDRRFLCSTQPWPPPLWQKDWAIHEGKERFQRFLSMVTDFVLVSRSGPVRDTVQAHIMVKQRMHTLTACPLPTWLWGSQFLSPASSAILGTKPSAHGHSVGTQDGNYSRSHLECGRRERHCAYSRSTQISTCLLGQEQPLFLCAHKGHVWHVWSHVGCWKVLGTWHHLLQVRMSPSLIHLHSFLPICSPAGEDTAWGPPRCQIPHLVLLAIQEMSSSISVHYKSPGLWNLITAAENEPRQGHTQWNPQARENAVK